MTTSDIPGPAPTAAPSHPVIDLIDRELGGAWEGVRGMLDAVTASHDGARLRAVAEKKRCTITAAYGVVALPAVMSALRRLDDPTAPITAALSERAIHGEVPDKTTSKAIDARVDTLLDARERAVLAVEAAVESFTTGTAVIAGGGPALAGAWTDPGADHLTPPGGVDHAEPAEQGPDVDAALESVGARLRETAAEIEEKRSAGWPDGFEAVFEHEEDAAFKPPWSERCERDSRLVAEAVNRMKLYARVLAFRSEVHRRAGQILADAWGTGPAALVRGVREAREVLTKAVSELEALGAAGAAPQARVQSLRRIRKTVLADLEKSVGRIAAGIADTDPADLSGRRGWETLLRAIDKLPPGVVIHGIRSDGVAGGSLTIDLLETAGEAFVPPWPKLLEPPGTALRNRLVRIDNELDQVIEVVEFNLDDAIAELVEPERDMVTSAEMRIDDTAADGVRRAAEKLNGIVDTLAPEWFALTGAVRGAVMDDWAAFCRSVFVSDQVTERIEGARTRAARLAERLWLGVQATSKRVSLHGARLVNVTGRRARRLIARGQAVVGVADIDELDPAACLAPLAKLDEIRAGLPRVYRRLFTLEPLTGPTLAYGRGRVLVEVKRYLTAWMESGAAPPLVIVGPPGAGRTTILNLIEDRLLEDAPGRRVALADRPGSTEQLAMEITRQSEWTPGHDADVCLIDDAEHLMHIAFGRIDTVRAHVDFLTARPSVLWILAMSAGAWRYLTHAWPDVTRRVDAIDLTEFDRDDIEALIMERHDRSGLPVVFQPDAKLNPLMQRRLRRAVSEERRQEILRAAYFDGLAKAASGSIGLAIAHWVLSSKFNAQVDHLSVDPVVPLDLTFLDALAVDLHFALRAFWIHGTLDVDELAACLRSTALVTAPVIRRLTALGLLRETASGSGRYQLTRLLLGPVEAFLTRRSLISDD